jgi:pSer/pThr/pTyr-binding forkhead associated (FHA) protein
VIREFPLAGERTTIGRMAGSDIELKDPGASREHAEIRRTRDGYAVVDLGSTNGTMVNNATVKQRDLTEGDLITIGRTTLEFRSG